jgi:hypothetical protein
MRLQFILMLIVLIVLPVVGSAGQETPWGDPDLQGIWSNATITPLERPPELAGQEFFTEEEAAQYTRQTLDLTNRDRRDGTALEDLDRAYNDFWWDSGTSVVKTLRTSIIIDPPNGRIPPLTHEASKLAEERAEERRLHATDGPENMALTDRCIWRPSIGPPILPTAYNNNYQIVQSPGNVAILAEMMHAVRIIPLDNRPHLPATTRQWLGDSRGHWEGDTLVVETTNFTKLTNFGESSDQLRVIERFRREDAYTLMYEFTIDDKRSFDRTWTGQTPMVKSDGVIYEYACHEGNYAMSNVLAAARAEEASAAGDQ